MKHIAIPALILTLLSALATDTVGAAPRDAIQMPPEPSRAAVREALAKRRALQIKRLKAYRDRGMFPRNRVSDDVINVFSDELGLLCAVANLIFLDGDLELVAKTARENPYVKMGKLESGALFNWILGSGFTIEEIAAIQLPDSPVRIDVEWAARENARIVAHLDNVAKQLAKNADASLDAATDRLMAAGRGWTVLR